MFSNDDEKVANDNGGQYFQEVPYLDFYNKCTLALYMYYMKYSIHYRP
jgi:hypothetical protein